MPNPIFFRYAQPKHERMFQPWNFIHPLTQLTLLRINIANPKLGGGFKYFLFSSLSGEDSYFDEHIFQMGWFNHQLGSHESLVQMISLFKVLGDSQVPFAGKIFAGFRSILGNL